jgi:hypothetical protein
VDEFKLNGDDDGTENMVIFFVKEKYLGAQLKKTLFANHRKVAAHTCAKSTTPSRLKVFISSACIFMYTHGDTGIHI